MNKKILIDAAFREETRVAVISDGVLEDYDREDFNFKQLKGNIYLAKITRIEPSLQAAFIDYGDSKKGLLHLKDALPQVDEKNKSEEIEYKKIK